MTAALSIFYVLAGLVLLERSSDAFVDGAAMLARRFKVSPFIIGMVIIGFGTSAPELCVSLIAGLSDRANLSLGNAYGSCVFNITAILGVTAFIRTLTVKRGATLFAGLVLSAVGVLSMVLAHDLEIARYEAFILLGAFAVLFPVYCFFSRQQAAAETASAHPFRPLEATLKLTIGLAVLVGSSQLLVKGAADLARLMGVSELMIGLTVIAIGTSLPELAAAIQSARRGEAEFVLGNIIGSNLFNLLVVVGLASSFNGARGFSDNVFDRDIPATIVAAILIALFGRNGKITRLEGTIWLFTFVVYLALTIYQEIL